MSESRAGGRRWVWFGTGAFIGLVLVCGGLTLGGLWLFRGIGGMFTTPLNPTNQPDVVHTFPGSLPADLAFSPDGKLLAVLTPRWREIDAAAPTATPPADPPQLVVFDVTSGAKVFTTSFLRWPRAVAFSPDGKHLIVGLGSSVTKVEDDPRAELVVYAVPGYAETYHGRPGPDCHPDHLEFAPDSSLLFVFCTDDLGEAQSVTAWQFPTLTVGPKLKVTMTRPECATVTADGTIVLGGRSKDYTAVGERFDRDGTPLGPLKYAAAPNGAVVRLVPNMTAKTVMAVSAKVNQDFDTASGEPVGTSRLHSPQMYYATHAGAGGSRVAEVSHVSEGALGPDFRPWYTKGGFLHVINLTSGKDRKWRTGCWQPPVPVAFSPDGKHVAAGFDDTAGGGPVGVKVWVSP